MIDYLLNGQANGNVASTLLASNFNISALRPVLDSKGRSCISVINNAGEWEAIPVANTTATLRKDDWKILDDAVVKAAKPRLRAVGDLRAAGLTFNIPNGLSKTVLETETQSDISAAAVSMDGMRQSKEDRPVFDLTNLPLPIIHKDFSFSARQLAASRNGGSPLDTTTAELAGRRVAESAEGLLIGTLDSYKYGGGTIYGYTNLLGRMTKTITAPTDTSWTGATTVAEVLAMRTQAQAQFHYGPYNLYSSPDFDQYLDDDYKANSALTTRERLANIENINVVRTLDTLTGFTLILVQMTPDVVREVIGMDLTTVQWETHGGMQINFKVMAILTPQLRLDQNGNGGIVHGTSA